MSKVLTSYDPCVQKFLNELGIDTNSIQRVIIVIQVNAAVKVITTSLIKDRDLPELKWERENFKLVKMVPSVGGLTGSREEDDDGSQGKVEGA